MIKINKSKSLSREFLANPYQHLSLKKRLIEKKSVNLTENSIINTVGNGYIEIKPINTNKLFT